MQKWPFEDPPNMAVLTTKAVWMAAGFFRSVGMRTMGCGSFTLNTATPSLSEEDGRIVSLESMWRADPSVAEVADLAPGWVAWRDAVGRPWRRTVRDAD